MLIRAVPARCQGNGDACGCGRRRRRLRASRDERVPVTTAPGRVAGGVAEGWAGGLVWAGSGAGPTLAGGRAGFSSLPAFARPGLRRLGVPVQTRWLKLRSARHRRLAVMEVDPSAQAVIALTHEGFLCEQDGDIPGAMAIYERALAMAEGDHAQCVAAHFMARHRADAAEELKWNLRALELAHKVGDDRVIEYFASLRWPLLRAARGAGACSAVPGGRLAADSRRHSG
jgi:hypothetical protein